MKQGQDITAEFPGVFIIHQKIRGNAVEAHVHAQHEIFFPLQGEIRIAAGSELLAAGPGKMIYLPPKTAHSFRAAKDAQGERLILIVEDRAWKAYGGTTLGPSVATVSQLSKELVFHLLIHPKSKATKALLETLIRTASETLENARLPLTGGLAHLGGRTADARVKAALALIEREFHRTLPVEALAKRSGLSPRNLNRLFLEELGVTPKQAITLQRIEVAKTLLRRKGRTVTDVALEVGYGSVSQFITVFRKLTGRLPSHFQP